MGVVVRRYIDILKIILFPTPLVLAPSLSAASLLFCSFLNVFSFFSQTLDIHSKSVQDSFDFWFPKMANHATKQKWKSFLTHTINVKCTYVFLKC